MQIAFISGNYLPKQCGVSHYIERLRQYLRGAEIQSLVLTTARAAEQSNDPSVCPGLEDWTPSGLYTLSRNIMALQAQVDILHIQFAQGNYRFRRPVLWLPLALRLMGWRKPIVTTLHEYGNWEWYPDKLPQGLLEWLKALGQRHGWWDREDGFMLTLSDRVISTNGTTDQLLQERLPDHLSRVHTIPLAPNVEVYPIDRQTARAQLRQVFHWQEDAPVIAFFGFIHPVKGLETLLRAFAQLNNHIPQARLLMIGGTNTLSLQPDDAKQYFASLENLVAKLGLSGKAVFTGYLPNELASHYLQGSDVGVLPFNHGVNLKSGSLFAMLTHGLPCVVTRYDPPVDLFEQGNLLKVCEPKDVDGWANQLQCLLSDSNLRRQLAENGQEFSRLYSWEAITQEHIRMYRELTKNFTAN